MNVIASAGDISGTASQPRPNGRASLGGHAHDFAAGVLVACAAFVFFARTIRPEYDFVNLDDPRLVLANPAVRDPSWSRLTALLGNPLRWWSADASIPRLTAASLMFDGWLSGAQSAPQPQVFHRTAVLLHVLNVVLVFGLMRRLGAGGWGAAALAAVFAVHPVQVESVAWVSRRETLLGATFALLAVRAYVERRPGAPSGTAWFVAANVFAVLAALADPAVIALPLVFLLLDVWPLRRWSLRAVIEKLPLLAVFAAGPLTALRWTAATGAEDSPARTAAWMLRNFGVVCDRLALPQRLAPLYPSALASLDAYAWNLITFGVFVVVAIAARRRAPILSVGLAAFLLLLAPALPPTTDAPGLARDHAAYLPLAFLLMPAAAWQAQSARRRAWNAAAAAIAVALAAAASPQIAVWRDGETLFRYTMSLYPDAPAPKAALADWLTQHGRADEALPLLRQAVRADPASAANHYHLGLSLYAAQRPDQALAEFAQAAMRQPDVAAFQEGYATALRLAGRWDEARAHYETARDLAPDSAEIRLMLGFTYLQLNLPAAARAELQEALSRRPTEPAIHLGLACAWARMHVLDKCRAHLATAVSLDPASAERAGREPTLRALAHQPGFEGLIVVPDAAMREKRGGG